jgi:hypothetical protein
LEVSQDNLPNILKGMEINIDILNPLGKPLLVQAGPGPVREIVGPDP